MKDVIGILIGILGLSGTIVAYLLPGRSWGIYLLWVAIVSLGIGLGIIVVNGIRARRELHTLQARIGVEENALETAYKVLQKSLSYFRSYLTKFEPNKMQIEQQFIDNTEHLFELLDSGEADAGREHEITRQIDEYTVAALRDLVSNIYSPMWKQMMEHLKRAMEKINRSRGIDLHISTCLKWLSTERAFQERDWMMLGEIEEISASDLRVFTVARDEDSIMKDRIVTDLAQATHENDIVPLEACPALLQQYEKVRQHSEQWWDICFISNNLLKSHDKGLYDSPTKGWSQVYTASMFVPVIDAADRETVLGFLCVDAKPLNDDDAFDRELHLPVLHFYAELLSSYSYVFDPF